MEDTSGSHTAQLTDLLAIVTALQKAGDNAENRQRKNIRVVSLLEGTEDPHLAVFVEKFLKQLLSI